MPKKEELIGLESKEIAAKYDVTEKTALRWLTSCGLRAKSKRLNKQAADEIRTLSDDMTVKELAAQFGISLASVYRILRNVTYRNPSKCFSGEAIVNVQYNDTFSFAKPNFGANTRWRVSVTLASGEETEIT